MYLYVECCMLGIVVGILFGFFCIVVIFWFKEKLFRLFIEDIIWRIMFILGFVVFNWIFVWIFLGLRNLNIVNIFVCLYMINCVIIILKVCLMSIRLVGVLMIFLKKDVIYLGFVFVGFCENN